MAVPSHISELLAVQPVHVVLEICKYFPYTRQVLSSQQRRRQLPYSDSDSELEGGLLQKGTVPLFFVVEDAPKGKVAFFISGFRPKSQKSPLKVCFHAHLVDLHVNRQRRRNRQLAKQFLFDEALETGKPE